MAMCSPAVAPPSAGTSRYSPPLDTFVWPLALSMDRGLPPWCLHSPPGYGLPCVQCTAEESPHPGGEFQITAPSWLLWFSSNSQSMPDPQDKTPLYYYTIIFTNHILPDHCSLFIMAQLWGLLPPPPPPPMLGAFLIRTRSTSTPKPLGYSQTHPQQNTHTPSQTAERGAQATPYHLSVPLRGLWGLAQFQPLDPLSCSQGPNMGSSLPRDEKSSK